jgi:hypothetical protein
VSTCAVLVGASSNYWIGICNLGCSECSNPRCSSRFRFEVLVQSGWLLLALLCVCAMVAHGTVVFVVNCC